MRTIRDVTPEECHCIGPDGVAVTLDPQGDYPFFELPKEALV